MPEDSQGTVVGWYTDNEDVLVRFWDGGPLRVPGAALEILEESPRGSDAPG